MNSRTALSVLTLADPEFLSTLSEHTARLHGSPTAAAVVGEPVPSSSSEDASWVDEEDLEEELQAEELQAVQDEALLFQFQMELESEERLPSSTRASRRECLRSKHVSISSKAPSHPSSPQAGVSRHRPGGSGRRAQRRRSRGLSCAATTTAAAAAAAACPCSSNGGLGHGNGHSHSHSHGQGRPAQATATADWVNALPYELLLLTLGFAQAADLACLKVAAKGFASSGVLEQAAYDLCHMLESEISLCPSKHLRPKQAPSHGPSARPALVGAPPPLLLLPKPVRPPAAGTWVAHLELDRILAQLWLGKKSHGKAGGPLGSAGPHCRREGSQGHDSSASDNDGNDRPTSQQQRQQHEADEEQSDDGVGQQMGPSGRDRLRELVVHIRDEGTVPHSRLRLVGADLGDEGVLLLARAVRCAPPTLKVLLVNLSGNGMGDQGAMALASALVRCRSTLHALCLARNRIGSQGTHAVGLLAARCPKLGVLYLAANPICDVPATDPGAGQLMVLPLPSHTKTGSVKKVVPRTMGVAALINALARNKTLSTLSVRATGLDKTLCDQVRQAWSNRNSTGLYL